MHAHNIFPVSGLSDNKRVLITFCDEGRKYHPDVQTELEDSSEDR
jgi:hypothetical protein